MTRTAWTKLGLAALFAVAIVTFFALDGPRLLSLESVKANRDALLAFADRHFAVALALGSSMLLGITAALVAARALLARRLSPDAGPFDWALGELLLLAAFARSVTARTVAWRGRVFHVARGGRMRPVVA